MKKRALAFAFVAVMVLGAVFVPTPAHAKFWKDVGANVLGNTLYGVAIAPIMAPRMAMGYQPAGFHPAMDYRGGPTYYQPQRRCTVSRQQEPLYDAQGNYATSRTITVTVCEE